MFEVFLSVIAGAAIVGGYVVWKITQEGMKK